MVAVVTGGSRGIGRGIALGLGEAGATVYVTGRTIDEDCVIPQCGTIQATAHDVTRLGGQGIAVRCDHADDTDVTALFQRVREEHGRLDLLVNNATSFPPEGPPSGIPFWELPVARWDEVQTVGLRSHYVASALAAPLMIRQHRGLIVNISSLGAVQYVFNVPYGVGKAGVEKLTADLAHDLFPYDVAVVALRPLLKDVETISSDPRQNDQRRASLPRFTGRVIAALAGDSRVMERTGRVLTTTGLADEYGLTKV
jgi:dehydrogenase/reductase SDR family protein 1